jgi:hypothetical protein
VDHHIVEGALIEGLLIGIQELALVRSREFVVELDHLVDLLAGDLDDVELLVDGGDKVYFEAPG